MKQRATNTHLPRILAIDTSCDDTAAAVTCGTEVWSNIIASQTELHSPYGGVFPTVAKQAHKENIAPVVALALRRAGVTWADIAAIAVTQGPGLAPALEVGIAYAKELAQEHNLPLYPINHIEGHLLSPLAHPRSRERKQPVETPSTGNQATSPHANLSHATQHTQSVRAHILNQVSTNNFPTLGIIVSGGHTQFVLVVDFGSYIILGETVDDAVGECLDKIGRMLNLGYPAGPIVEQFAKLGDPRSIAFPLPMTTSGDYNLSFSGLKTFARNLLEKQRTLTTQKTPSTSAQHLLSKQEIYDWCASLQYSVFRHICHKLNKILEDATAGKLASVVSGNDATKENDFARSMLAQPFVFSEVWLGGGVAANAMLRKMIRETLKDWYDKKVLKEKLGTQTEVPLRSAVVEKFCTTTLDFATDPTTPYGQAHAAPRVPPIGARRRRDVVQSSTILSSLFEQRL